VSGPKRGVADTSVLIAHEVGRRLDESADIDRIVTTVVTLAELQLGVLAAADVETRARRLATFDRLADIEVLEATADAAHEWARLRLFLREHGRRMEMNDLWIAAIAVANNLPVVTQDSDFNALDGAPGVALVRV
jgi:predicted nucleic acid-binding protein